MWDRDNGFDDEFDYAGAQFVAAPYRLRGLGRGGLPRDYVGKPIGKTGLGGAVDSVLDRLQGQVGAGCDSARSMRLWRKMSDKKLKAHTHGLFLRQNRASRELVVYVDASIWMYEFTMMAPMYLQEWNRLCEREGLDMKADKIRFQLSTRARKAGENGTVGSRAAGAGSGARAATGQLGSGPAAAGGSAGSGGSSAGASGSASAPGSSTAPLPRVPLSADERDQIARTVAVIKDERLRAAAYNAMRSHMELEKSKRYSNVKNMS